MDEVEWWEFDTPAELAEQVVGDIGFVLESAAEGHGGARIAMPGRDLPKELYRALLTAKGLDWSKVTIVPTHDSTSGAGQAEALQAMFGAKGANVVELADGGADVRLGELHWPLDLALLAVGADGSVGGIRPAIAEPALSAPRARRAVTIGDGVTLTAASLNSARAVMIVLEGAEQRAVVERAIKDGPLSAAPIGRVLAEIDAGVDIFWTA